MLIAVTSDWHFGARSDDLNVYQHMKEFFQDTFFPELEKRNIKHVIHMGDVFDRKKYLNTHILTLSKKDIFDKLNDYETHVIIGNHDDYFQSSNDTNSSIALKEYSNFHFYPDPSEIVLGNLKILFIPWINKENFKNTLDVISKSKSKIVFGHLELNGFEYHTGTVCKHGLSVSLFDKFDQVYSGHFHKKSSKGNITYLGSPYQTTWIEHDQYKGFHIFDTETLEMEFVENPNRLFVEITNKFEFDQNIKGKYVRVSVTEEDSKSLEYDQLKNRLEENGVIKVTPRITESIEIKENIELPDEAIDEMKIPVIAGAYIDKLEFSRKDDLKELMETLYRESINA